MRIKRIKRRASTKSRRKIQQKKIEPIVCKSARLTEYRFEDKQRTKKKKEKPTVVLFLAKQVKRKKKKKTGIGMMVAIKFFFSVSRQDL